MGIAVFLTRPEPCLILQTADSAMYVSKRSHPEEEPEEPSLRRRRDDAAARLVAELIPLLASPGELLEKLTLIGNRLAAACRYDGVRIAIFGPVGSPPIVVAMVGVGGGRVVSPAAFKGDASLLDEQPLRSVLEATKRPLIVDDLAKDTALLAALSGSVERTGRSCSTRRANVVA